MSACFLPCPLPCFLCFGVFAVDPASHPRRIPSHGTRTIRFSLWPSERRRFNLGWLVVAVPRRTGRKKEIGSKTRERQRGYWFIAGCRRPWDPSSESRSHLGIPPQPAHMASPLGGSDAQQATSLLLKLHLRCVHGRYTNIET